MQIGDQIECASRRQSCGI